ncbi:MAG: 23S rRNA (adenine(2503)-C(2))-methyltransferase RlmN [Actinomyces sp.]|nr:MAG: 23S rRNA (adenine(2503)-C(2))-methyltransferase RlmN [Actinomyces sp.]
MTPTSLLDLDRDQLAAACADEPPYRVDQIWRGLYERAARPAEMTDLPLALRRRLSEDFAPALTEITRRTSADGGTVKWLWRLHDDRAVETVLMHYDERVTVCVSTQAGCAMGCGFCATGQAGFERHLSTGEIVAQVLEARRAAAPRRVSNVVFMGMGEPLANYDRTWAAIERIHDDMGISARHITVSTVGLVPGIERLATERLPVNLAVSLHAADDELRDRLVPVNRRWPLEELARACEHHRVATGRRLSFEWALIDGVNDRPDDARRLAAYAKRLRAHVNLIPLNPTPGWPTRGTPPAGVRAFRDALARRGVNVTVRRNRGADIEAACGQLRVERRPRNARATSETPTDSILER